LSKLEFARSLGASKERGYSLLKGVFHASREILSHLSKEYKIDLNWYLLGEGSPYRDSEVAAIELYDQEAAAGGGIDIQDYAEERTIRLPRSLISPHRPESLRAVYVKGDSMIDEHIYNGDAVVYHPGLQSEVNGIYVLSLDTTLLVKRFF
jgi:SOS-response transcriptional repressor LexA